MEKDVRLKQVYPFPKTVYTDKDGMSHVAVTTLVIGNTYSVKSDLERSYIIRKVYTIGNEEQVYIKVNDAEFPDSKQQEEFKIKRDNDGYLQMLIQGPHAWQGYSNSTYVYNNWLYLTERTPAKLSVPLPISSARLPLELLANPPPGGGAGSGPSAEPNASPASPAFPAPLSPIRPAPEGSPLPPMDKVKNIMNGATYSVLEGKGTSRWIHDYTIKSHSISVFGNSVTTTEGETYPISKDVEGYWQIKINYSHNMLGPTGDGNLYYLWEPKPRVKTIRSPLALVPASAASAASAAPNSIAIIKNPLKLGGRRLRKYKNTKRLKRLKQSKQSKQSKHKHKRTRRHL